MKVLIIFVAFVWAALTPAAMAAARSDPQQLAADWRAHPPQRDEIFRTRQDLGPDAFKQAVISFNDEAYQEAGLSRSVPVAACRLPQWYLALSPLLSQAQMVTNKAEWQAGWARIDAAMAARATLHANLLAGDKADQIYGFVAARVRAQAVSGPSQKPFVREIEQRVLQDQMAREDQNAAMQMRDWAKGLAPQDMAYVMNALAADLCVVDRDNTNWLKRIVALQGWPLMSEIGETASGDLWLMAQHADQDVAFQKDVLARMEPLVAKREVRPDHYAYLYDRVAHAEGHPQRYGTQGACTGPGQWEPFPSESPEALDARRAAIGLNSESQYQAQFPFCAAPRKQN